MVTQRRVAQTKVVAVKTEVGKSGNSSGRGIHRDWTGWRAAEVEDDVMMGSEEEGFPLEPRHWPPGAALGSQSFRLTSRTHVKLSTC